MARRPPRVPLVVDVEYGPEGAPLRRRTRNVGTGGLFIATNDPLPEGTPVGLRFALPGQAAPMSVEALVVWAEPLLGMGLRFVWLDPVAAATITRYVAGRLADEGEAPVDIPDPLSRPAPARTLYLAPPDDLRSPLEDFLASEGFTWARMFPDMLAVPLADEVARRIWPALRTRFSGADRERCKGAVTAGADRPTLRDLVRMPTLGTLVAAMEGEWLAAMLHDERLESHFQPIVHVGSPGEVFGYEALVRGRTGDGSLVPPLQLYAAGRAAGLLFALDRLARLSAVRGAAAHRIDTHLFINVNPATLGGSDAHLGATCDAIAEAGLLPERTVFEIVESDRIADVPQLLRMLETYRWAGFAVALDDLGAGYSSLTLLTQLRPDFVKLDMGLVRGIDADPYRAEVVARILDSAHALGIRTIAEGIETEAEWRWFKAHGAGLAQGFLFARPGLPPPAPRVPAA